MGRLTLVAGRRRWSFTAAWASAALRACSLSSARPADAVPRSALKLGATADTAACGPPPPLTAQTEASGPAVPRSRHPDVHAPTFRAHARVTILRCRMLRAGHRVSRGGWRHLVICAATVRATFPVCSSTTVGRAGPEWTRVNGARQIRRARRRNRRLVRQPPWRDEKRRSPTASFDVPGIPLPTRAPRELGNATNALVSPAMSANAPDFASFVLPRSGATGALVKRALEAVATCRDISFQVGFQWIKVQKNPQIPN